MEQRNTAQECLRIIIAESERLRALVTAYERDDYDDAPDNSAISELKDQLWTLDAADVEPIAAQLNEQMAQLDEIVDWLDGISDDIDTRYQNCMIDKKQAELNFIAMRKKVNGTNLSRGIWPIYGGVLVGVMAAFLANQFDLGMVASIVAGAAGYFVGNQLMQQITKRMGHPAVAKKDDSEERAALDKLRGAYEALSREHDRLTSAQDYLTRASNQAEDLQFAISEALHELDD